MYVSLLRAAGPCLGIEMCRGRSSPGGYSMTLRVPSKMAASSILDLSLSDKDMFVHAPLRLPLDTPIWHFPFGHYYAHTLSFQTAN